MPQSPGDYSSADSSNQSPASQGALSFEASASEIGFGAQLFIHACFPYSQPDPTELHNGCWVRSNGLQTLFIQPGPLNEIPHGTYPRLFIIWLTTEVTRRRSQVIQLGRTFSDFCRKMGIARTGGRKGASSRFKEQLENLLNARIIRIEENLMDNGETLLSQKITEKIQISDRDATLWIRRKSAGNTRWTPQHLELELSAAFYEELSLRCIPLKMEAVHRLRRKPFALDIYQWLAHRFHYLEEPTLPTWDQLAAQFGTSYSERRYFRRAFIKSLQRVLIVYPEAQCQPLKEGLLLHPSPTPVERRFFPAKKNPGM